MYQEWVYSDFYPAAAGIPGHPGDPNCSRHPNSHTPLQEVKAPVIPVSPISFLACLLVCYQKVL